MESQNNSVPVVKKSHWLRWIGIGFGGLLGLLVIGYFVATSSGFLKSMILPKVGAAIGMQVTADEISLSPFSQVVVRGLKVESPGAEPLFQSGEIKVKYDLAAIMKGRITVSEIAVASPVIRVAYNDKTSNLDPIFKTLAASPAKPAAKSSQPVQLDLKNLSITGAKISYVKIGADKSKMAVDLSNVNLAVDQVQNGQPGKITLSADTLFEQSNSTTNSTLQNKITGTLGFKIGADLMPQTISGSTRLEITGAQGAYKEMASLAATLQCELTPTAITQLSLGFEKQKIALGKVSVSGPFDLNKHEGRLNVSIDGIDRQVLNLAGASAGIDFAKTTLSGTNLIELAKQGQSISAQGHIVVNQFGINRAGLQTPVVDLALDYNTTTDLSAQSVLISQLALTGRQKNADLLKLALNKPMSVSWANGVKGAKDVVLDLAVNGLDLNDWGFLAGAFAPKGVIQLNGQVSSQSDGKVLAAQLQLGATKFAVTYGSNVIALASIQSKLDASIEGHEESQHPFLRSFRRHLVGQPGQGQRFWSIRYSHRRLHSDSGSQCHSCRSDEIISCGQCHHHQRHSLLQRPGSIERSG